MIRIKGDIIMKKSIFYLMALTMLLMTIYGAMAAITPVTPSTAGDTVTGTYGFNITTSIDDIVNCTWATTADGIFAVTVNSTPDQVNFTNSSLTTGLTDAEDTTLTMNCTNATTSEQLTLTINVDNAVPVCSYTYDSGISILTYNDLLGLDIIQSSTDTTDITYAWVLYDPEGNSQVTSTDAEPTDFQEPTTWDDFGDFILALTLTDEAGKTTACDNITFTVTSKSDDAAVIVQTMTQSSTQGRSIIIILIIFVIMLIAIAGFVTIGMSKKRKK